MQRVFGGQVAAQALVAAARTSPDEMHVHSMHSYFLRPGDTAVPIVYDVDRLRDGRSFATRRVLARQHGRPIYALTASFQVAEEGVDHQDRMPDVPGPEESEDVASLMPDNPARRAQWEQEWAALDLRRAADSLPGGLFEHGDQVSRVCYWVRVTPTLPDDLL